MARRAGDVFVADGESRQDTAVLLIGTAGEYGLRVEDVHAVPGGFYITEELASLVGAGSAADAGDVSSEQAPPKKDKPAKKTSGNRAGKNNSNKEE